MEFDGLRDLVEEIRAFAFVRRTRKAFRSARDFDEINVRGARLGDQPPKQRREAVVKALHRAGIGAVVLRLNGAINHAFHVPWFSCS